MVRSNVDNILKQVSALELDEREELMCLLEAPQILKSPPSIDNLVIEALRRDGIYVAVPPPLTPEDIARFNSFTPAKIEGRPISEVLVEERR